MKIIKKIIRRIFLIVLNGPICCFKMIKYEILCLLNNPKGINEKEERKNKIIVSLTAIPSRFNGLHLCIETIMRQSMKPDRIILYLGNNTRNIELPQKIKKLQSKGLEIEYREDKDLKPHTKYFYAMQENPKDIIITVDDDILYDRNTIKNLYKSYLKHPNSISAMRVHKITFKDNEEINKYNNWKIEYKGNEALTPNHYLCATGVGSILYPPHIMPEESFERKNITDMALNNDDLWLKIMQIKNDIKVVKATKRNYHLYVIKNTQTLALNKTNVVRCENDEIIKDLIEYYKINKEDFN